MPLDPEIHRDSKWVTKCPVCDPPPKPKYPDQIYKALGLDPITNQSVDAAFRAQYDRAMAPYFDQAVQAQQAPRQNGPWDYLGGLIGRRRG